MRCDLLTKSIVTEANQTKHDPMATDKSECMPKWPAGQLTSRHFSLDDLILDEQAGVVVGRAQKVLVHFLLT